MLPIRIKGATRNLGAPKGWNPEKDAACSHLPIKDVQQGRRKWMVSRWEPTPAEIERLLSGSPIELWVEGIDHPVVGLNVPEEEDHG